MEPKLMEIARRIRGLREMLDITAEDMAGAAGVTLAEYEELENGNKDFSFTFLYRCAETLHVDMIELLTGENPHLTGYTVIKQGAGLPIKRRKSFEYYHLAANFKNKLAEPFLVKAPYHEEEQNIPIHLSTHEGQEFDYILKGSMRFVHENHVEELTAGDSVFYDSGRGHGMIATGGEECLFLAVILKPKETK